MLYECPEDELGKSYREHLRKQLSTTKPKGTGWTHNMYRKSLIIEFKLNVREFIHDRKKSIEDIDILVVWSGRKESLPSGWRLVQVPEDERMYQETKYKLFNRIDQSTWVLFMEDFMVSEQN